MPPGLTVLRASDGYDGQFYYRFALDPFSNRLLDRGILVDQGPYRHQRILYPLLAWFLSGGGRAAAVPWMLLGINLAGLAALGGLAAGIARRAGRHPAWGLLVPLAPCFLLTLRRDLTEILASAFLLGAALCLRTRRPRLAGGLLLAALLSRETTLLFSGALGAAWCWRRFRPLSDETPEEADPSVFLPPFLLYAALQLALRHHWGEWPWHDRAQILDLPLRGFVTALQTPQIWAVTENLFVHTIEFAYFLAFLAFVVLGCARGAGLALGERIALAGYALLAVSFNEYSWVHDYGFLRQNAEAFLLGWLLLLEAPPAWRVGLAAAQGIVWASVAGLWLVS